MKIPRTAPQFTGERALVVVTGTQGGTFYFGTNGEMVAVGTFEVPAPRYSDREGFFASHSGTAKSGISGAVREFNKPKHVKDFLARLRSELRQHNDARRPTAVYLFAPQYLMRQTRELVRAVCGTSYRMSFAGNYLKERPLNLVGMIGLRQERKASKRHIVPTKREAAKILRRK